MSRPPSTGRRRTRLLTLAYLGLSAVDTWLAGSRSQAARRARLVTKPMLMPTLAASLATDPRATHSPLRTSTLAAQGFGWAGDIALLRESTVALTTGAGCFAAGHVAYLAGFASGRDRRTRFHESISWRTAAALTLAGGPAMALGATREDNRLGPAVLGYTGLVGALLGAAGNLDPALPASARQLGMAGAALFNLSDTVLGLSRFWWVGAPPRTESVVMGTYTAAQLLISKAAAHCSR